MTSTVGYQPADGRAVWKHLFPSDQFTNAGDESFVGMDKVQGIAAGNIRLPAATGEYGEHDRDGYP